MACGRRCLPSRCPSRRSWAPDAGPCSSRPSCGIAASERFQAAGAAHRLLRGHARGAHQHRADGRLGRRDARHARRNKRGQELLTLASVPLPARRPGTSCKTRSVDRGSQGARRGRVADVRPRGDRRGASSPRTSLIAFDISGDVLWSADVPRKLRDGWRRAARARHRLATADKDGTTSAAGPRRLEAIAAPSDATVGERGVTQRRNPPRESESAS